MSGINFPRSLYHAALILALLSFGSLISVASAKSFTNSTPATVINTTITRDVTVSASSFPEGSAITDVNISITFAHLHTSPCDNRVSIGFYNEVSYRLEGPDGTSVDLVNVGTFNHFGEPTVTILFDDDAGTDAGGYVQNGDYRPVGTLAAFNGKDPTGVWTLYVGDANGNGRHCFDTFTLAIFTDSSPVERNDDPDGDGIPSWRDNCPRHFNPDQEDGWGSSAGDLCDTEWYNRTGVGVAGFVQKTGTFHLHGNCIFLADGAPRCPVIAAFNPGLFDADEVPLEISSADAGTWSVWLYHLYNRDGTDVYQINVYSTNPPQADTLIDDRLEIHVSGGSWRWYHRGGSMRYQSVYYSTSDQEASLDSGSSQVPEQLASTSLVNALCQPSRLAWISCAVSAGDAG